MGQAISVAKYQFDINEAALAWSASVADAERSMDKMIGLLWAGGSDVTLPVSVAAAVIAEQERRAEKLKARSAAEHKLREAANKPAQPAQPAKPAKAAKAAKAK